MKYIFIVEYSESKKQLREPISNYLLAQSLIIFSKNFEISRKIAFWIVLGLHSQYYIIMMSSFSILKNYSYPTMNGTLFFFISSFSFYKI
jgi:hypothetical protein